MQAEKYIGCTRTSVQFHRTFIRSWNWRACLEPSVD